MICPHCELQNLAVEEPPKWNVACVLESLLWWLSSQLFFLLHFLGRAHFKNLPSILLCASLPEERKRLKNRERKKTWNICDFVYV